MLRLPVRALAELVHRRGHLHLRLDGRTRAEEGIAAQRKLQQDRPEHYHRERPVALVTELGGLAVMLSGRIDGCDLDGPTILVEEVKCTRADAEAAHAGHASVHWAQARLYAGLLARELADGRDFELRLIYCHPTTLTTRTFSRPQSAAEALAFLDHTLVEYGAWLERQAAHQALRNRHLRELEFPFPDYRPFQRAMARRTYRALRDREHLLLEAPTGSGKTAATLFPAVRALDAAGYRRVLFLTSRSTGALAARDAVRRMDPDGDFLRRISVVAKDKACFLPGTPCEPDACPYARGYYDRYRPAVVELLERRDLDPDTVAAAARAHQVCPFELSLDTASWCDVVVADYNYVLDPLVRLQRFAGDPETALLVDEAHQLAPRTREMLSLTISRNEVADALAERPPAALARRIRSLDRALLALRRQHDLGEERVIGRPDSVLRSMQRLVDEAADSWERPSSLWERSRGLASEEDRDLEIAPTRGDRDLEIAPTRRDRGLEIAPAGGGADAVRELLFVCHRWLRSESWYHPERFRFLGRAAGRGVELRLACIDPGTYLRERFDEYGGHVRFSGTVSPLALYARLHGEADAPVERAGNPFDAGQLRVLVVDDIPVYLRERQRTLGALVELIHDVVRVRPGHHLVAFPSFDYLVLAADAYRAAHPDVAVLCQSAAMSEHERREFLAAFHADAAPHLGFVVLGGVFGESVDFSDARLAGVICVGVGLPPPSLTREELARHFAAEGLDGTTVAYTQPAMVKVLQMAGRLLRSPTDRGVLCLVDPRFRGAVYQQFFPQHWRPRTVHAAEVAAELVEFERGDAENLHMHQAPH